MAGGMARGPHVPGSVSAPWLPGETPVDRDARLRREAVRAEHAASRRSFTRPSRPGFCWIAVELAGHEVERPGVVARWLSTPEGWWALVTWVGLDGDVRTEWVDAASLTEVRPERAP